MNNPHIYQSTNQPINIPVSFSYSQQQEVIKPNEYNLGVNPTIYKANIPTVITQIPINSPGKTKSQIVYATHPTPQFPSSVQFGQSQINQPKIFSPRPETLRPQNLLQNYSQNPSNIRAAVLNRNISDYRRSVSPMNSVRPQMSTRINTPSKNKDLQKYDSLRWQNKYEDLKTKYFQLLTIVESHSNIEDSWLLEEQNKLLREKIKLLEEKDQKYYGEVAKRVQKLIDFHKETTTTECALLIDRYRLQSKYLQKI